MRLRRDRSAPSPWAFFSDFPRILPYLRPHKRLAAVSLGLVGFGVADGAAGAVAAGDPASTPCSATSRCRRCSARSMGSARYQLLALAVVAGLVDHRPRARPRRRWTTTSTRSSTRAWCSTCAATCSATPSGCRWPSTTARSTGQLMFQINNQASAVGAHHGRDPAAAAERAHLVGMFADPVPDRADAGAAVADGRARHLLSAGYYAQRSSRASWRCGTSRASR